MWTKSVMGSFTSTDLTSPGNQGAEMKRHRALTVGYGRPPVSTRFKPGQSGNPKGRPKGKKNMFALLQGALDKQIPIREGGSVRKVPTREAIILALISRALKGD